MKFYFASLNLNLTEWLSPASWIIYTVDSTGWREEIEWGESVKNRIFSYLAVDHFFYYDTAKRIFLKISINKWITRNNWIQSNLIFVIGFKILPFACRFPDCSGHCYCRPAAAAIGRVSRSAALTYSASRLVSSSKEGQNRSGTRRASNLPSDSARSSSNAAFLGDASSLLAAQVFLDYSRIIKINLSNKSFLWADFGPSSKLKILNRSWHYRQRIPRDVRKLLRPVFHPSQARPPPWPLWLLWRRWRMNNHLQRRSSTA